MEDISFELVGKKLEEDIVSELGILLLKKGTILTETNVLLLKKHNYRRVKVSEDVSFKNSYLKSIKNTEAFFLDLEKIKEKPVKSWFKKDENLVKLVHYDPLFFDQMYRIKVENNLYRHSVNVGLLAFFLGKLLRFSYKDKLLLWQMGVLHDIGKLAIVEELRDKHLEDVDVEDEDAIKEFTQHPELGWSLLKDVKGINAIMLNAVRYHHEKIDGSGFPKMVKVKYLPVMVQIISVANEIDKTLTANPNIFLLINKLIEETRSNKLSPAIVTPFTRYLMRKFVGEKVRLSNGKEGEIAFIFDQEPSQPLIYFSEEDSFLDMRKHYHLYIEDYA